MECIRDFLVIVHYINFHLIITMHGHMYRWTLDRAKTLEA